MLGQHTGNSKRRVRNVHWRTADVAPEIFVLVRDHALLEQSKDDEIAEPADTREQGAESERDLLRICDYGFIMSFKTPDASPLPDPERAQGIMKQYGFLPLGIAHDTELDAEAVYVLISDREPPVAAPPYLIHNVWSRLVALLGGRLDKQLHVILLGTGGRVVERAVDFFYYQVEIKPADRSRAAASAEPLSVDVQPGDPRQIAQARYWLRDAINRRTSDIHLEPQDGSGRLRFRIDGELIKVQDGIPATDLVQVITWIKAQAEMDISERRRPLDGGLRLSLTQGNKRRLLDVRISVIPTVHGQKMVLRLLDPETLLNLAAEGLHTTILDSDLHDAFANALMSRGRYCAGDGTDRIWQDHHAECSLIPLVAPIW
jgi:hypothetical protein